MNKYESLETDDSKYQYTIRHFTDEDNAVINENKNNNIVSPPALGRMKLWESFKPVDNKLVEDILRVMRHTWMTVPLMLANPSMASAAKVVEDLSVNDVADAANTAAKVAEMRQYASYTEIAES